MKIIPAIDIIDGKCVRLSKGDYDTKKIYHENPLDIAKEYEANGIQYLHLVDLDGAKAKTMMASFSATCDSVNNGSPFVRRLQTNTIAVQGAAARRISPAM